MTELEALQSIATSLVVIKYAVCIGLGWIIGAKIGKLAAGG